MGSFDVPLKFLSSSMAQLSGSDTASVHLAEQSPQGYSLEGTGKLRNTNRLFLHRVAALDVANTVIPTDPCAKVYHEDAVPFSTVLSPVWRLQLQAVRCCHHVSLTQ